MSVIRHRTKTIRNEKVYYSIEYGLDDVILTVRCCESLCIRYEKPRASFSYEISSRLLQLFYKLLEMELSEIETTLGIIINSHGVTDKKGNRIVMIQI